MLVDSRNHCMGGAMMDTWIWTWLTMLYNGLRIRYGGCVTWGVQYRAYGKIPFQRFINIRMRYGYGSLGLNINVVPSLCINVTLF